VTDSLIQPALLHVLQLLIDPTFSEPSHGFRPGRRAHDAVLANVLLDEVDRVLECRGHRFALYADDCNVYVRSQKAGERVLLRRCYDKRKRSTNYTGMASP